MVKIDSVKIAEYDRCLFCGMIVLDHHNKSRRQLEEMFSREEQSRELAGLIGNKKVCTSCIGDVSNLLEAVEDRSHGYG